MSATDVERGAGKNLSVRLPQEHLNIVAGLAKVDGVTMGEVIREAILTYGETRRQDPTLSVKIDEVKRQLDEVLTPTSAG
jgi:predicted DNA-binding protein